MNRIPDWKRDAIADLLRQGKSTRYCERAFQTHKNTVSNVARFYGIDIAVKKATRVRQYRKGPCYAILIERNEARSYAARVLARSGQPMVLDDIWRFVKTNFPHISKDGMKLMLCRNVDGNFARDGKFWKYAPAFFLPGIGDTNKRAWAFRDNLYAARKLHFDRLGQRDELIEVFIRNAVEQNKAFLVNRRIQVAERSRKFFQMMNAAVAISNALTHENTGA